MAQKPFSTKGTNITSPKGKALWCKVVEPDRMFNDKGSYSTSLVCDPNNEAVKLFIKKLEEVRDAALEETVETLGDKGKVVKARDVYTEDDDGNVVFKFKMNNIDDREPGDNKIIVVGADRQKINNVPLVGNDSIIRCVAYANPYYMATTKEVGISLFWTKLQILDLVEFGGGDDLAVEDGYTEYGNEAPQVDFENDELDF